MKIVVPFFIIFWLAITSGCSGIYLKKADNKPPPGVFEKLNSELTELYDKAKPGIVVVYSSQSPVSRPVGTGILISHDGYVVTNEHVVNFIVENNGEVNIELYDGLRYSVRIIGRDPDSDLALLKIDSPGPFRFLALTKTPPQVGQFVLAVGHPFGYKYSANFGIISGVERQNERVSLIYSFLQTDVGINPGNSGGPLLNMRGEVVGIDSWTLVNSDNMGFAIPAAVVDEVVQKMLDKEKSGTDNLNPREKDIFNAGERTLIKAP